MTDDLMGRDAVLNRQCFCITLDAAKLDVAMRAGAMSELSQLLSKRPGRCWQANASLSPVGPPTVRPTGEGPCRRSHLNGTGSRRM